MFQSTTKNVLIDNHYKLFMNQSEVTAAPSGCLFMQNIVTSEISKQKETKK